MLNLPVLLIAHAWHPYLSISIISQEPEKWIVRLNISGMRSVPKHNGMIRWKGLELVLTAMYLCTHREDWCVLSLECFSSGFQFRQTRSVWSLKTQVMERG